MNTQSAQEQRDALITMSRELLAELKRHTSEVYKVIGLLGTHADSLMLAAADEKEDAPTVRRIVTKPMPIPVEQKVNLEEARGELAQISTGRKRRTCSICHKPGHWAKSCPEGQARLAAQHNAKRGRKRHKA
jgi:hypothetical protein